ncbi:chaplin family protein [Streptomyces shenzhenensis]|uniref:chaplin family protein n=1 Tax=Streptomyces shenzhenensis TaxID=943815 RepID=UPI003D924C6E
MRKIMTAAVLGASSASLVLTSALGAAAAPAAPGDSGNGTSALSGNLLQLPLNIPVTVCGNTISILGLEPLSSGANNGCKHAAQPEDTAPVGGVAGDAVGGVAGGAVGDVAGGVAGDAAGGVADGLAGGVIGDLAPDDLLF